MIARAERNRGILIHFRKISVDEKFTCEGAFRCPSRRPKCAYPVRTAAAYNSLTAALKGIEFSGSCNAASSSPTLAAISVVSAPSSRMSEGASTRAPTRRRPTGIAIAEELERSKGEPAQTHTE